VSIALTYDENASPQAGCPDPSEPQGLCVRLNETFLPVPLAAIGASSTELPLPTGPPLRPGRNVLSAFVRSSDPEATDGENNGFLVRHRVFFYQDQDRDGIPDADEIQIGSSATSPDSDADGLFDAVEQHLGSGIPGIPGTSRTGHGLITSVRPAIVRPGRPFAVGGTGLEAFDQPGEAFLGGLPAPLITASGAPQTHSPTAKVFLAPASLAGSSALLTLADAGGSHATATVSIDTDSAPMIQNVVLFASAHGLQFFDADGNLEQDAAFNIPFVLNTLPNGSSSKVLIDVSRSDPAHVGQLAPDLELILRTHGGVTDVTTRLFGLLGAEVLQGVELLVVLLADPVASYSSSEREAIAQWLRVPGRRLMVVSGPNEDHAFAAPVVGNEVLAAVGADSRFDLAFPPIELQMQDGSHYTTFEVRSDPPFTNGVAGLVYIIPTSISVGAGAIAAATHFICLDGFQAVQEPGFPHPMILGCRQGEGPTLPTIRGTLAASETVPTDGPGTGSLTIDRVAPGSSLMSGAINPGSQGFVELPPSGAISVRASFSGIVPSLVLVTVGGLTGPGASAAAAVDQLNRTITANGIAIDPRQEAISVTVTAFGADGSETSDSILVRPRRQRMKTRTVVFADNAGTPAIAADVLARNQRQAGFELAAMCSPANGVLLDGPGGVPLPGIEPSLLELAGSGQPVVVANAAGADLVLKRDGAFSREVGDLVLRGVLPGGLDPGDRIPNPVMAGPAAVRVFVAKTFKRAETQGTAEIRFDIPQDTEAGISQFAQAFFQVQQNFEDVSLQKPADAVIVQASGLDLEAGSLRTARPVASSLAHELAHVLAGVQDTAAEALGSSEIPFAFPDPSNPSVMNTFPFFRSLQVGSTVLTDCSEQEAGDVSDTTELCRRIVSGYACGTGIPAIDFTE